MTILVTGSAGFIGANFVLDWLALHDEPVVSLDKLTYAGNRQNLASLDGDARHTFVAGDIGDSQLVARLLAEHQPRAILNFAAESHVDRSIHGPEDFIQTNIVGTFRLLEEVRAYWGALEPEAKAAFRLLHVSTDEVYGSLAPSDPAFTENNRYEPNSPYSASKAAVLSATRFLAREWATKGVRVNSITPGFFPAEQNRKLLFNEDGTPSDRAKAIFGHTPMGRFGDPSELAGAAVYLASEKAASFVTGSDIVVDGGFLSTTI